MKNNTVLETKSQSSEFLPVSQTHIQYIGSTAPAAQAVGVVPISLEGVTLISSPSQVANFGIDTIEIGFHVAFDHPEKIFPALAEQKSWLQSGSGNEIHFKFGKTDLFSWNLQRTGTKQYPYMMCTADISLGLTPQLHTGNKPNVFLKIGSMSCQEGLEDTIRRFKNWLHYIGGTIFEEKISRIDIATDIKEHIENTSIEDYHRHICRSRFCDPHIDDRKLAGITIGRGAILLRVYDKIREMESKQAHEKQSFFAYLWGGEQKQITRAEFQLRRKPIKEMFPEDSRSETVIKALPKIWRYLTEEWFRHADGYVDRENKHQSRSEVSNFWEIVQKSAGFSRTSIKRTKKQIHIDIPALKKMVRGCMVAIAAGLGHVYDDFFGIMSTCRDVLENEIASHMETAEYRKKFALKQAAAYVTF